MRLGEPEDKNNKQIQNFQDELNKLNEQIVIGNNAVHNRAIDRKIDSNINELTCNIIPDFETMISKDWENIQPDKKNNCVGGGRLKEKRIEKFDEHIEKGPKLILEQLILYAVTIFTLFSSYGFQNPNNVINIIIIVLIVITNIIYLISALINIKRKYTNLEDINLKEYKQNWIRIIGFILISVLIGGGLTVFMPSTSSILDYFIKLLVPGIIIVEVSLLVFQPQALMKKSKK